MFEGALGDRLLDALQPSTRVREIGQRPRRELLRVRGQTLLAGAWGDTSGWFCPLPQRSTLARLPLPRQPPWG